MPWTVVDINFSSTTRNTSAITRTKKINLLSKICVDFEISVDMTVGTWQDRCQGHIHSM